MDKINDELKKLELEIADVKRRLQTLPDGSLACSRNGNYWKWYWNCGDGLSYLLKSARPMAEKLAVRKYLSLLLRSLQARRAFLDSYLARKARPLNRLYRLIWRIPLTSRFSLPILPLCPRSWPSGQRPPMTRVPCFRSSGSINVPPATWSGPNLRRSSTWFCILTRFLSGMNAPSLWEKL